jgi:hypothetical protein
VVKNIGELMTPAWSARLWALSNVLECCLLVITKLVDSSNVPGKSVAD